MTDFFFILTRTYQNESNMSNRKNENEQNKHTEPFEVFPTAISICEFLCKNSKCDDSHSFLPPLPLKVVRYVRRFPPQHHRPKRTIHDILTQFRDEARSNRDLGDRFERLICRYLQLDPLYAKRFSNVWMWNEWPPCHRGEDRPRLSPSLLAVTGLVCLFARPLSRTRWRRG